MAVAMVKLGAYSAWLSFLGTALTCAFLLLVVLLVVFIGKSLCGLGGREVSRLGPEAPRCNVICALGVS